MGWPKHTSIAKTISDNSIVDDNGCWIWTGLIDNHGYGRSWGHRNITTLAHRLSYAEFCGPLKAGLTIDHLCRVRNCVNPAHLEQVSRVENTMRGYSLPAQNSRLTHCKHGHEFNDENTYIQGGRRRQCRACNAAAVAKYSKTRTA